MSRTIFNFRVKFENQVVSKLTLQQLQFSSMDRPLQRDRSPDVNYVHVHLYVYAYIYVCIYMYMYTQTVYIYNHIRNVIEISVETPTRCSFVI
jgi:hypothetical protein